MPAGPIINFNNIQHVTAKKQARIRKFVLFTYFAVTSVELGPLAYKPPLLRNSKKFQLLEQQHLTEHQHYRHHDRCTTVQEAKNNRQQKESRRMTNKRKHTGLVCKSSVGFCDLFD